MNEILDIVIRVAGTLAGLMVIYLLKMGATYLESRLDEREETVLDSFVSSLVAAAEQMYKTESGEARLSYVQTQLIEAGYELTDALRALIESKVYEINLLNGVDSHE